MRKLLLTILFISNIFAAIITGDQSRVSVVGGSIDVSSQGVTQTVNSGEITFIGDGKAPSKARKINRGDLNSVNNNLNAKDPEYLISLKYPNIKKKQAERIRRILVRKGINNKKITITRAGNLYQLKIRHFKVKLIKNIYPEYYQYAKKIEKKFRAKNRVPYLSMKLSHLKKYHRNIFRR